MRRIISFRSQVQRRPLVWSAAAAGFVYALSLLMGWPGAQAQSLQKMALRYVVETKETATFYLGKEGKINLALLDQNGYRVKAPRAFRTTITATTFDGLDQAKSLLASRSIKQQAQLNKQAANNNTISATRRLVLGQGQQAAQIVINHGQGEDDKNAYIVSYQPGRVQVFVESDGVATGQAVIIVLDPRRALSKPAQQARPAPPDAGLMPIFWQNPHSAQFRLELTPSKLLAQIEKGEQVGKLQVALRSAVGDDYPPAPEDLQIILKVEDGNARFEPNVIKIPRNQAISPEAAVLRTRPGGRISVSAYALSANNYLPARQDYNFVPGVRTTDLTVRQQRNSAFANGLDEIELRVEALQDGRVIAPEDEGMDERLITFTLSGDTRGIRFENGKSELHIPKGQTSGTIKLFSSRPIGDFKVVGSTLNGLRETIVSEEMAAPLSFSFPWLQLFFAIAGGSVMPLLRRQSRLKIMQGLVLGAVFFGLALFGAIVSNPQTVGAVSIVVTKLPTENFFASFILGFLGSLLLGINFTRRRRAGAKRKAAAA
ncbi:MAG TPA: hypothetical protein VJ464_08460 [Blastocatellia bacterium]|nr:hypothetical protein [Blastocatellia bacterium]